MKQKVDHDGLPGRGVMYLLDFNDRQIRRTHYCGKKERDLHIEEWRKQYAKAFNSCSIQIAPGFKVENVDKFGFNTRLRPQSGYTDGVKTKSIKATRIVHYTKEESIRSTYRNRR